MKNYFFTIINKEDSYRFNLFVHGKLKHNRLRVWGNLQNPIKKYWKEIKKNDVIFFGNADTQFTHYATVNNKQINKKIPRKIFGTDYRSKALTHIIYFKNLLKTNIGFSKMLTFGKLKTIPTHGTYKISQTRFNELKKITTLDLASKTKKTKTITLPDDFKGPPKKRKKEITSFDRATAKTKKLKKLYQNKCQICGYRIKKPDGDYYSEVHHLWPLGAKPVPGDDDYTNMLVVCPTHHKEFDCRTIFIDEDCVSVNNNNGKKIGRLFIKKIHKLSKKNIIHQLETINE